MNIKFVLLFWIIMSSCCGYGQSINLEFPYFVGKTYYFKIVQGEKEVVLQEDTIRDGGKVRLFIPDEYKGYRGMAKWYLTNSETGGGLDLVISGEDFSVSCMEAIPTDTNIVYSNTKENVFLIENSKEQQKLFARHDAMLYAIQAYPKTHALYPVFESEQRANVEAYVRHVEKLAANPLYAARFREIANLTIGIGSIITQDEQLKGQDINDFMVNKLDYGVLYTSFHWGGIINSWVQLQLMLFKDDARMIADARIILDRMPTDKLYTEYVSALTRELSRVGKDNVVAALAGDIKKSGRLLNFNGVLAAYHINRVGKAPDLQVVDALSGTKAKKRAIRAVDFVKKKEQYALLLFYRSDCGPCESTLQEMIEHYDDLVDRGVRIITVSADTEEQVFKDKASQHPWADKFCDLEGFGGVNFKNYAVIGTPTMYLINKKGAIVESFATFSGLLERLEQL